MEPPKASLSNFNTFGIESSCEQLHCFSSESEIQQWLANSHYSTDELFVIGGGSNLLLIGHVPLIFLQADIQGIVYQENDDEVLVTAGAGVNWHELVTDSLAQGYSGLENLSLIPGNVGASPIQNIGAYGVELKDLFVELRAIHLETGQLHTFNSSECEFGYRDSVFKNALKGQYLITFVTLCLHKKANLKLNYGPLKTRFADREKITPKMVSDAVIDVRSSKLPDPNELGNAGSFFKNPIVDYEQFAKLKKQFPEMVGFEVDEKRVKIAAGWLIEQAGLKGYRQGDAGVHKNQALVLVNYGDATGQDILSLAKKVQQTVLDKFAVKIEPEVWIIGEQDLF